MAAFDPHAKRQEIEAYLGRTLDGVVRLLGLSPLPASTRQAPWQVDVEVDGTCRAFVLQVDPRRLEHEYRVLRAVESLPIPAPRAYGLDLEGQALGRPCFFSDFLAGESLLDPMLAGERWAEDLYIDTACALNAVTREQLAGVDHLFARGESALDVLEAANDYFRANPHPLAEAAYERLRAGAPPLPGVYFGNGDLWPDNLIVRDRRLVGVIDWANAGWSDPFFEFLLPFFLRPELRGRGIEERYCRRMGFDPGLLHWYHGLEFFDSWHWVLKLGEPYEQHTAESLEQDLRRWLAGD